MGSMLGIFLLASSPGAATGRGALWGALLGLATLAGVVGLHLYRLDVVRRIGTGGKTFGVAGGKWANCPKSSVMILERALPNCQGAGGLRRHLRGSRNHDRHCDFFSWFPASCSKRVGAPSMVLVVWAFAGILTLFGGARLCGTGRRPAQPAVSTFTFNRPTVPCWDFSMAGTQFIVAKTGSIAAIATGFVIYLAYFFSGPQKRNLALIAQPVRS